MGSEHPTPDAEHRILLLHYSTTPDGLLMTNPPPILDRFRLDGRVAVVTGASRGIGKAIALALASAGADVALLGRDEATLAPVAREIESELGRRAAVLALDVADLEAHAGIADAIVDRL